MGFQNDADQLKPSIRGFRISAGGLLNLGGNFQIP